MVRFKLKFLWYEKTLQLSKIDEKGKYIWTIFFWNLQYFEELEGNTVAKGTDFEVVEKEFFTKERVKKDKKKISKK